MEGPSLVIACEEFAAFKGKRVTTAAGTAPVPMKLLRGRRFRGARSWGKHFLLEFETTWLRIHFLMFGSYRINDPRESRTPKLTLRFGADSLYFYSCAIRPLEESPETVYDWSVDIMAPKWSSPKAVRKLAARPAAQVCDVLMDQEIFAGVGNIIKNEVLYRLKLDPRTTVGRLDAAGLRALVRETRAYSLQFYRWKKANVLKRNWKIFRKRVCPTCGGNVRKQPTGKLERISHFCPVCQSR